MAKLLHILIPLLYSATLLLASSQTPPSPRSLIISSPQTPPSPRSLIISSPQTPPSPKSLIREAGAPTPGAGPGEITSFDYEFDGFQPIYLTYQGDAHFPKDTTYLRLTKTNSSGYPQRYSAGRVLFMDPVQFWVPETGRQVNFETTIKFKITAVDNSPGDGLVFFFAPVGSEIPNGYSGGNFGVFTTSVGRNPSIFVVEFDTFKNSYDPNYPHIGINIEHQASNNTTRVDNAIIGQEVTVVITYQSASKMILARVYAARQTFEVSYSFDLSTVLNEQVQVGLAATTGGSVSNHDIILWKFTATLEDTVGETMLPQYA